MVPRILIVAALALVPSVAHADDDDDDKEWFLSMGGSFAYTIHDRADNGGSLGLEISAGKFWLPEDDDDNDKRNFRFRFDPYWAGLYVDILRDTSLEQTRISIGPEFGRYFLGVDAGLLVQLGDDHRYGISVRPALTFAFASLTVRYGRYWDGQPDDELWELGLLVKYPLPVF